MDFHVHIFQYTYVYVFLYTQLTSFVWIYMLDNGDAVFSRASRLVLPIFQMSKFHILKDTSNF